MTRVKISGVVSDRECVTNGNLSVSGIPISDCTQEGGTAAWKHVLSSHVN